MEGRRLSVAALIPAAGQGTRLGAGPKAFVRVAGRTLIEHAVRLLAPFAGELAVAVPADRVAEARAVLDDAGSWLGEVDVPDGPPRILVVPGGADRQDTVERLLDATSARWLLVHDAARPLTPPAVVARVLEAMRTSGAATAGIAVADTLHDLQRDRPVPRDTLRAVQTPQGFEREVLVEAHRAARAERRVATDDANLVRALGRRVAWAEGSPWSHKLTHPADRTWLEALAAARSGVGDTAVSEA